MQRQFFVLMEILFVPTIPAFWVAITSSQSWSRMSKTSRVLSAIHILVLKIFYKSWSIVSSFSFEQNSTLLSSVSVNYASFLISPKSSSFFSLVRLVSILFNICSVTNHFYKSIHLINFPKRVFYLFRSDVKYFKT